MQEDPSTQPAIVAKAEPPADAIPGAPVAEAAPAAIAGDVPPAADGQVSAAPAEPAEETVLVHYSGAEPLTKGGITWEPDQAIRVPVSLSRRLIGSDNLRKVDDEELFNAIRAKVENLDTPIS